MEVFAAFLTAALLCAIGYILELRTYLAAERAKTVEQTQRLVRVLASAQGDRVQHELGLLGDEEYQAKKKERDAFNASFGTSD